MKPLHDWNVSPKQAIQIQKELASQVIRRKNFGDIKTIAGADVALDAQRKIGIGGVIVYSYPKLEILEKGSSRVPLLFPYVPGLLAFREGPALLAAFEKLSRLPDLILFDGQGIAHPRRLGIASHLGLWLDRPTVGCAKSRLMGTFEEPEPSRGSGSPLREGPETVGAVLRTRDRTRPIFVSVGHKIDLDSAIQIVLSCCDGRRLPKPTREADQWVGQNKRRQ